MHTSYYREHFWNYKSGGDPKYKQNAPLLLYRDNYLYRDNFAEHYRDIGFSIIAQPYFV